MQNQDLKQEVSTLEEKYKYLERGHRIQIEELKKTYEARQAAQLQQE